MSEHPSENDEGVKTFRRFFAFIAILVVMIGQIYVFTTPAKENIGDIPSSLWIDLAGMAAGMALFAWSQNYRPGQRMLVFIASLEFSGPTYWLTAALVFSLLAVIMMQLFTVNKQSNYIPVITFWLFAGMVYVAGFFQGLPSFSACKEWVKLHRYELVGVGLVTLLGLVLRFYKLGEIPRVVNGDEGRIGLTALSTSAGTFANPFSLWENFGGLYLQSINYFFSLFGTNPFALRILPAIGGTLAIPALYLLARQISSQRIAFIAIILLAFSHTHLHFSRTVAVAYIQGTWLIPLELYFLLSGLTQRSSWRTALAGVLLAIHFSIYLDSQIIAGLILVYMLISFVFLGPWFRPALKQAFAFWGGFLIMILPELFYAWQNPNEFFDRLTRNGTYQTGWLAQEVAGRMTSNGLPSGIVTVQILGERFVHAFLSLIYYPSFDFYGSPIPILSMMTAALFLIGLGIVLWETRSERFLLLNGYFWAGTLSIALFAIPVSADTYRMLIVLPAALLMAAVGLDRLLQALGAGWAQAPKKYIAAAGVVLCSLMVYNLWVYYFDFAGRCLYGSDDPPTRYASYLGNYAGTFPRDTEIYLLSDPVYFYGSHLSVDFLSHQHPITNVSDPADTLQIKPGEVIVATPNRVDELRNWASTHPGGKLHNEYDCSNNILVSYEVP